MAGGLITGADIISRVRQLIAEPVTNRWSDAVLLGLTSDAQLRVASDLIDRDAPWPTATTPYAATTMVGNRIPLSPCLRVLRMYLYVPNISQQLLPGTDIPTLEGDNLLVYDSSSNNVQGGLSMTPQWLNQQPQSYPIAGRAGESGPLGTAGVYQDVAINPQQPPVAAIDGGWVVIVPPPSGTNWSLLVDNVPLPMDLVQVGDYCIFPQNFRDIISYDVAARTQAADGRDSQVQMYESKYAQELEKMISWRNGFQGNKPRRFSIIPPRTRLSWDV